LSFYVGSIAGHGTLVRSLLSNCVAYVNRFGVVYVHRIIVLLTHLLLLTTVEFKTGSE